MSSSIESVRGTATGLILSKMDVSVDALTARRALRGGILAYEDNVETACDCLLETLNRYGMENEQLKNLLLDKDAVMTAMCTCILEMEKR